MNCTQTQLPQCTQQPPELAGTAQQSWHLRCVGWFLVEPIWGSLMPAWPASCKADRVFPLKTSHSAPSLKMLSLYHPEFEVKVFVLGEGYSRQSKIAKPQNCQKPHLEDGSKPPKRFKTRDVRQPKQKPLRSAFKNHLSTSKIIQTRHSHQQAPSKPKRQPQFSNAKTFTSRKQDAPRCTKHLSFQRFFIPACELLKLHKLPASRKCKEFLIGAT